MRRSTLLISRHLLDDHPFLKDFSGNDMRLLLQFLMNDPNLPAKVRLLRSSQYTKIYQEGGQDLQEVKFYPFPEDWCQLSAIANGTGFSRCFVFVFLLKFWLGIFKLDSGGNIVQQSGRLPDHLKTLEHQYKNRGATVQHFFQSYSSENAVKGAICKIMINKQTKILDRKIHLVKT